MTYTITQELERDGRSFAVSIAVTVRGDDGGRDLEAWTEAEAATHGKRDDGSRIELTQDERETAEAWASDQEALLYEAAYVAAYEPE